MKSQYLYTRVQTRSLLSRVCGSAQAKVTAELFSSKVLAWLDSAVTWDAGVVVDGQGWFLALLVSAVLCVRVVGKGVRAGCGAAAAPHRQQAAPSASRAAGRDQRMRCLVPVIRTPPPARSPPARLTTGS
jgi:hypothetical protein